MYSPSLLPVLRSGHVKAFAFIAEEGLVEAISRILPEHVSAVLGKYQRWLFLFDKINRQHRLDFSASVIEILRNVCVYIIEDWMTWSHYFSKESTKSIHISSRYQLMSTTLSLEKGNLRRVWRQLMSRTKGVWEDCVFCKTHLHTKHFEQGCFLRELICVICSTICVHTDTYTHTYLMQFYGGW